MAKAKILIGVTGGIAAYKSATLVSQLVQADYQVQVVMTQSAHQFIGPATFFALTGRKVCTDMFDPDFPLGPHIELAREYDLMCVAPATANFLSKAAHGASDDLLSTLFLCFTGPVILAPAMNCEMWENAATQANVGILTERKIELVGPESGWLSCRTTGIGRMSEPETIRAVIEKH